jgi:hypothetical protein
MRSVTKYAAGTGALLAAAAIATACSSGYADDAAPPQAPQVYQAPAPAYRSPASTAQAEPNSNAREGRAAVRSEPNSNAREGRAAVRSEPNANAREGRI